MHHCIIQQSSYNHPHFFQNEPSVLVDCFGFRAAAPAQVGPAVWTLSQSQIVGPKWQDTTSRNHKRWWKHMKSMNIWVDQWFLQTTNLETWSLHRTSYRPQPKFEPPVFRMTAWPAMWAMARCARTIGESLPRRRAWADITSDEEDEAQQTSKPANHNQQANKQTTWIIWNHLMFGSVLLWPFDFGACDLLVSATKSP